jgi:hypothetical protein
MALFDTKFFTQVNQVPTQIGDVTDRLVMLEAKQPVRLAITLLAGNTATIDLAPYKLKVLPRIDQVITFSASNQMFIPVITEVTLTKLVVSGRRTKGTLLLSGGPIEACAAGDVVTVWVIPQ